MILFDPQKTFGYHAYCFEKQVPSWLLSSIIHVLIVMGGGLGTLSLLIWFGIELGILGHFITQWVGLFITIAILVFLLINWRVFLEWLKAPHPKKSLQDAIQGINQGQENSADWVSFDALKALLETLTYFKRGGKGTFSFRLLRNILRFTSGKFILRRLGINPEALEKHIMRESAAPQISGGKSIEEILLVAFEIALARNKSAVSLGDLLAALAKNDVFFYKYLFSRELDIEDVKNVSYWQESIEKRINEKAAFWTYENLMRAPGLGRGWAAGYTIGLDQFSKEVTGELERKLFEIHVIGHDKEIKEMERILTTSGRHNVLVVGESNTGKETVVYGLAKMIYKGTCLPEIQHKRVLRLDVDALLAGLTTPGEMSERIITVFQEAVRARNVMLVIEKFDNFVGQAHGLGKVDISSIIEPYLASPHLQVIGITDLEGFHHRVERNPLIMKLFERVDIAEPNETESILILEDITPLIEERNGVFITYPAVRDAVHKAMAYLQNLAMPEKAANLLEETAIYVAKQKQEKFLLPEDIDIVLTERTGIPIGKMAEREKETLSHLEEILHKRLINQEEAVKAVASAMRRARTGLVGQKRPVGSFLFLGPTGVGKTETAKALAEAYFGNESSMIRFDMSEYQDSSSINRFLGSVEVNQPGELPKAVRDKPFSLLLLDELEKAYPKILDLFLQVLDEGILTDAFGKKVNFQNTIIIATSNAGANLIRELVKEGKSPKEMEEEILDFVQKQGIFKPEFLNRFDGVIMYRPLSHEHLLAVAELMLAKLVKRLEEKDMALTITPELTERVVELGYKPEFGARAMRRVIQEKIEDAIAKKILSGELNRGDTVTINPGDLSQ